MKRWLPSPLLSAALWLLWLLLTQSVSAASVLMGAVLAAVLPLATHGLRPTQPRVRHAGTALRLLATVMFDMVRSAFHTLWIMLARPTLHVRSGFVHVPLDVRDPHALAALAAILCLTPGTAWAEVALDRSMLLLHVLDLPDEAAAARLVALVKQRYERPLMKIFES